MKRSALVHSFTHALAAFVLLVQPLFSPGLAAAPLPTNSQPASSAAALQADATATPTDTASPPLTATTVETITATATVTDTATPMASATPPTSLTPTVTLTPPFTSAPVGNSSIPLRPDFSKLGLSFVPNVGQTDPIVRFQVESLGGKLFFTPGEIVLALPTVDQSPAPIPGERNILTRTVYLNVVRVRFQAASPTAEMTGTELLPGLVNYFIGNDPRKWHTNLPTYAGILYQELYPGINLRYDGTDGLLKATFLVAPGADPSLIRWGYSGATSLRVDDATGDLHIELPPPCTVIDGRQVCLNTGSTLVERAPIAWQMVNDSLVPVQIRYTIAVDGSLGFALGQYDSALPLTLDPVLAYSTYLGGSSSDAGRGIVVDGAGNMYITGVT